MSDTVKNISSTSIGTSGSMSSASSVSSIGSGVITSGSVIGEGVFKIDMGDVGDVTASPDLTILKRGSSAYSWTDYGYPETLKPAAREILYGESMLPHLVRAKEEGVRRKIEMDTVVIDRGVAVAQGLDHADTILGLRVKYAKEGSLPMDSAFIMLKDKDKAAGAGSASAGAAEAAPKPLIEIVSDDGRRIFLGINQIIEITDYRTDHSGILIEYSCGSAMRAIQIRNPEEADRIIKSFESYYVYNR